MSQRLTGYLCLTLAMMTVGATVTASKVIAGGMAPFTATTLRFAVALHRDAAKDLAEMAAVLSEALAAAGARVHPDAV